MVAKCLLCEHSYCDKYSHLTNKKVSFHSLPKNGPVRAVWIEVIQSVLGKTWVPQEERRYYICSDHFKEESYKTYGVFPRLIDGSVPTENISLFDKENAAYRLKTLKQKRRSPIKTVLKELNGSSRLDEPISPAKKKSRPSNNEKLFETVRSETSEPERKGQISTPEDAASKRRLFSLSESCQPEVLHLDQDFELHNDNTEELSIPSIDVLATSTPFPKEKQVLWDEIDTSSIMQANGASPEIVHHVKIGGCQSEAQKRQGPKQKLYSELFSDLSGKVEKLEMQSQPFTEEDYKKWKKLSKQVHRLHSKLTKEAELAENLRLELIQVKKQSAKREKEWIRNQEKVSAKMKRLEASNKSLKKKLRAAREKIRRRNKKIQSLQDAIEHLKEENLINEDMEQLLLELPLTTRHLMLRAKNTASGSQCLQEKFDPHIRKFCITLHTYSPASYNYIRKSFLKCLPARGTIQRWMKEVQAEPGFRGEAFDAIRARVAKARARGEQVLVNLVVDDMALMERLEYDGTKVLGYVDHGKGQEEDKKDVPKASAANVYMIVQLNGSFKMPCGYHFVKSLDAKQRADMLKECIVALEDAGVRVESVTFDGASSNLGMVNELGAQVSRLEDLKNYFANPADPQRRVHILLDAAHMLKLLRKLLAMDKELLSDGDGRIIDWSFVENLYHAQTALGLKLKNKLNKRHIEWEKNKMKVKLAAQTCSASVAAAIEDLDKVYKLKEFAGSEGTVKYLRMVDRTFDLLNSSSPVARGPKAPMRKNNKLEWLKNIDEAEKYFADLEITVQKIDRNGVIKDLETRNVLDSALKTGCLGIITSLRSVKDIFEKLVDCENAMQYLLTYKLSQDHIEMLFGAIRRRQGCNTNPTCRGFKSCYKTLVVKNEIKCSDNGNAIDISDIKILHVGSRSKKRSEELNLLSSFQTNSSLFDLSKLEEFCTSGELLNSPNFGFEHNYAKIDSRGLLEISIVEYISGWVVKRISPLVKCNDCVSALFADPNSDINMYSLIANRTNGGLVVPALDVVKVCRITENLFQENLTPNLNYLLQMQLPLKVAISARELDLFSSLSRHVSDLDPLNGHINDLVKLVSYFYLRVRLFARIGLENSEDLSDRNFLSRLIIFQGH